MVLRGRGLPPYLNNYDYTVMHTGKTISFLKTGGWFPFALGSPTYWLTPGLFPGPCKQLDANSNNGQLTKTDHVELFVMEMF